jgi:hypothetical protein
VDLKQAAAAIWMDKLDIHPGQLWKRALEEAVANCSRIVLIVSPASPEGDVRPDRLTPTHIPGGWSPPAPDVGAITGHEFGLDLKPQEREQLIAFLRTL